MKTKRNTAKVLKTKICDYYNGFEVVEVRALDWVKSTAISQCVLSDRMKSGHCVKFSPSNFF